LNFVKETTMSSETILWDRNGQPAFLIINDWLISPQGNMVGFLAPGGAVYTSWGQHTAWLRGGVLRDMSGHCLALSERPEDPVHPQAAQQRSAPRFAWSSYPQAPEQQAISAQPPQPRYSWSILNPGDIFC
jgi:hypothetical protein